MRERHIPDYPVLVKNGFLLFALSFDAALLIGILYGHLLWLRGLAHVTWDLMSKNLKQSRGQKVNQGKITLEIALNLKSADASFTLTS